MPEEQFGEMLKRLRIEAGFGLRQFAELIGEQPSRLSKIEAGQLEPWQAEANLKFAADVLQLPYGSQERQAFFKAANSSWGTEQ